MKKTFVFLLFIAVFTSPLICQTASNFTFKFDNGVGIRTEHDWGHIWVQQQQTAFAAGEEQQSVVIKITTFGELGQNTTFKLTNAGKDVRLKDAAPGTYDLKITSKTIGKPGSISFDVTGIVVKAKMKTTVTVTIYKLQASVEEAPMAGKGLASYESKVLFYKGNPDPSGKTGIITFYAKGAHDNKLTPDAVANDISGKIKPGTYDVLVSVDISGKSQKVWFENVTMKADISYKFVTNLNAGTVNYVGANRDTKQLHLYPAGTADRLQGATKPDKASEVISYEPAFGTYACPPGSYDVLLVIGTGSHNEWKKNVVVRSGSRTDIR
ncbi:MAG TPA: hypothetical protein VMT63_03000 [Bacteroidales bacterium]|nr:hypothetical protein [Bacteroidales bacterium]